MEEPLNPNPEIIFHFTITPLTMIRQAFDALIELQFNPTGLGVIEVNKDRVDFMAQNIDTQAVGNLRLRSTALKDFYFNIRFQDKLLTVNFRNIFDIITDADNVKEDSITFSHFNGSDNITINLGKDPLKEYNVRLLTMFPGLLERFPSIRRICAAAIPCKELRETIDRLESLGNNQLVSVDVQERTVSVSIEELYLQPWTCEVEETIGVAPGIKHHARFTWPHLDVLRKASLFDTVFTLFFLSQPENMIMIGFKHKDLRCLTFISKATLMLPNQPVN